MVVVHNLSRRWAQICVWVVLGLMTVTSGAHASVFQSGPGKTSMAIVTFTYVLAPQPLQLPLPWEPPSKSQEGQVYYRSEDLNWADWTAQTSLSPSLDVLKSVQSLSSLSKHERSVSLDVLSVYY